MQMKVMVVALIVTRMIGRDDGQEMSDVRAGAGRSR